MIVKLQRPLSDATQPWLCYPQDGSFQLFLNPSTLPSWVVASLSVAPKGYFEVTYSVLEGTIVDWKRKVRDAPW